MLKAIASSFPGGTNNAAQKLFTLSGANLAITTDQNMTQVFTGGTFYLVQAVVFQWASGAFNTACAGGIYTAAAKGGTAVVAAAQSYAALTGSGTSVNAAIAAAGTFSATPLVLSLTTGNTGALTANVTVWGIVVQ